MKSISKGRWPPVSQREDTELRAAAVRYDTPRDRIEIAMIDGWELSIERSRIAELAPLPADAMAQLALSPAGTALELDDHDVHISLDGLIASIVPVRTLSRLFARQGGKATSPTKQRSARENGRKGGRPRKPPHPAVA